MAKKQFTNEDDALLAELGVEVEVKKTVKLTPLQQRVIAGFEEIQRFTEEHGQPPSHGEDKDIFERLYAMRLVEIRKQEDCRDLVAEMDHQGLLGDFVKPGESEQSDEELLAALGVGDASDNDITNLQHVQPRSEMQRPDKVARAVKCEDFDLFRPKFASTQSDIDKGLRETRPFQNNAQIDEDEWFILDGQMLYVAVKGEEFTPPGGRSNHRMRVIYGNGTESDLLYRSLQRALNKDPAGRRITPLNHGPIFESIAEDGDLESGTVYVLRSKSENPLIKEHGDLVHKIGVTGDLKKRLSKAKTNSDPSYLMAGVEVVAEYKLFNINRMKLEKLIHRFFSSVRLDVKFNDRFGSPYRPKEWFLVPLFVIDDLINKIKDGSISEFRYDHENARIVKA